MMVCRNSRSKRPKWSVSGAWSWEVEAGSMIAQGGFASVSAPETLKPSEKAGRCTKTY